MQLAGHKIHFCKSLSDIEREKWKEKSISWVTRQRWAQMEMLRVALLADSRP